MLGGKCLVIHRQLSLRPHAGVQEATECVSRNTREATRPEAAVWEARLEVSPEVKSTDARAKERWLEGEGFPSSFQP